MLNQYVRPQSKRLLGRWFHGFLAGFCLVLMLGWFHPPSMAQSSITEGRVTEILDSSQVYIQNRQARVNDVAQRGQQVRTGNARTQVRFNTGAIARLSRNSVLTIGQCAQLQRGVVLVNGAANGCTSSVTAGVRGTTYILAVTEDGQEQIQVLEGEVILSRLNRACPYSLRPGEPTAGEQPIILRAGQRISTRLGEQLGIVEQLTEEDFVGLLNGELFADFVEELPDLSIIRDTFQQLFPNAPLLQYLPLFPRS
jgi:hypothetical protein